MLKNKKSKSLFPKRDFPKAMALFGSSSPKIAVNCMQTVYQTGRLLAQNGITYVYGVGDDGMMGAGYRGARSAGGKVFGVTTPLLLARQCADPSIYAHDELVVLDDLQERKIVQLKKSDALLIAPGGWGTLDEIATFGVHFKIGDWKAVPIIFLNYCHYWDGLLDLLNQMKKQGAITPEQLKFVGSVRRPCDILAEYKRIKTQMKKK